MLLFALKAFFSILLFVHIDSLWTKPIKIDLKFIQKKKETISHYAQKK